MLLIGDEDHIRLIDVELAQKHVQRGNKHLAQWLLFQEVEQHGGGARPIFLCDLSYRLRQTALMRILALDHGTKRIGVAVSDELKMIAQPLEYIFAEPSADFLAHLIELIRDKEVELILVGMPRNMDGSYGPAAQKVQEFVAVLKGALTVSIKLWDERLTSAQANRLLIQGNVRRDKRKEKVDKMAAAILLQSYLDSLSD